MNSSSRASSYGAILHGTMAIIQDQLKSLTSFKGDPTEISWNVFEYKLRSILETGSGMPDSIKVSLLKQKLEGAPSELIRLDPSLQKQGFEELMNWLSVRFQEMHIQPKEACRWQIQDTPDSYLVKIERQAEYDLPPLPPKKIPARDANSGLLIDKFGKAVMVDNPDFVMQEKRHQEYKTNLDCRIRREYIEGLKPSLKQKLTDPPMDMKKLHALVCRMYMHELQYPLSSVDATNEYSEKGIQSLAIGIDSTTPENPEPKGDLLPRANKPHLLEMTTQALHHVMDVMECLTSAMEKMITSDDN